MYQQNQIIDAPLSSQVEISVSCRNLINKDLLSKSDPVCQIDMLYTDTWRTLCTTEMIKDDLNPNFKKTVTVDYKFEEQQRMRFLVYDIDQNVFRGKINPSVDDKLGVFQCDLAEICGARGQTIQAPLELKGKKKGKAGYIIVRAEEYGNNSKHLVKVKFYGRKLKKMDWFGKSDPYFVISKVRDGSLQQTYKSEYIKNTLNPNWKAFEMPLVKLAGDFDRELQFDCFDWNMVGNPDFIGSFRFTVNDLLKRVPHTLRIKKKPKQNRGQINAEASVVPCYSLFEFLGGGLEISLMVAIDFTGSNGNPNQPGTLHYHQQGYMNEYESAIRSIGEILSHYDSDNKYPVFGFGARLPNGQVSHCFALNGNPNSPDVVGVPGILGAYKQALSSVQLYGPTYFSEVINVATTYASSANVSQQNQSFYVLLIITDGIINDMGRTIDAIVKASYQPLAIIIVGVGDADFTNMDQLDCDDGLLKDAYGKNARADIVQFVPFRKFKSNYHLLAKETLAEIPDQITGYFKDRGIKPNPKPQVTHSVDTGMGNWNFLKQKVNSQPQPQPQQLPPQMNNQQQPSRQPMMMMGGRNNQQQQQFPQPQQNWNLVRQQMNNQPNNTQQQQFFSQQQQQQQPNQQQQFNPNLGLNPNFSPNIQQQQQQQQQQNPSFNPNAQNQWSFLKQQYNL